MLLFFPILIGYTAWQIAAMAAGATVGVVALGVMIKKLLDRRHMMNMIEAYIENGDIGVEEYILATGLAKSDKHAQLVFKLMLPTVQEKADRVRRRRAAEAVARAETQAP